MRGVGVHILTWPCRSATAFFTLRTSGTRLCQADIDPHRACLHAWCTSHEDCDSSDIQQHDMFDHTTDSISRDFIKTARSVIICRLIELHQGADLPGCLAHAIRRIGDRISVVAQHAHYRDSGPREDFVAPSLPSSTWIQVRRSIAWMRASKRSGEELRCCKGTLLALKFFLVRTLTGNGKVIKSSKQMALAHLIL